MRFRNVAPLLVLTSLVLVAADAPPRRLPSSLAPEIYAWFWGEGEFAPGGYERFVDMIAGRSNFGLLTTSVRAPGREITAAATHAQVASAVAYAHGRGLRVAFDLDVRLARGEFLRRFPDQQQWMLRVRRVDAGAARMTIAPGHLSDHMTGGKEYELLSDRLAAAFDNDLNSVPVRVVEQSAGGVTVEPGAAAIVVAAFEYRTPDVFAPALLEFQNSIYEQYRDIPLDGGMKDEWGFPPVFNRGPRDGDFWYSTAFAAAWRAAGGGEMIHDCALMFAGLGGTLAERITAVDRYERLVLERNARIERHFYENVKRVWGASAFVGTHATWGIMPTGDAFKNGYDWWQAPRDYGQTDEDWPYPIRTSLAKRWGQPVWFNQYYNTDAAAYAPELWRAARNGGRINFHPLYPGHGAPERDALLLASPVMRAEARVRLLNYVTRAPIDSPVAIVFNHRAALNWLEPHFGDLGCDYADELARLGYRADVIPSSEIGVGALRVEDGFVTYGKQRYRAVVLLNAEGGMLDFAARAAASRTLAFQRGPSPAPGVYDGASPSRVARWLDGAMTAHPLQPKDLALLTDGTCILARGGHDPAGDPIDETFYCGNRKVAVRAAGVFAIRFNASGGIDALAASCLRHLDAGSTHIDLDTGLDVAVWHNAKGESEGVVQRAADVPVAVRTLAARWTRIDSIP
jgi:hypothetical protein